MQFTGTLKEWKKLVKENYPDVKFRGSMGIWSAVNANEYVGNFSSSLKQGYYRVKMYDTKGEE